MLLLLLKMQVLKRPHPLSTPLKSYVIMSATVFQFIAIGHDFGVHLDQTPAKLVTEVARQQQPGLHETPCVALQPAEPLCKALRSDVTYI